MVAWLTVNNYTAANSADFFLDSECSVAEMAERQTSSGATGVRSLPAAPLKCGRVTSVLNSLVGY